MGLNSETSYATARQFVLKKPLFNKLQPHENTVNCKRKSRRRFFLLMRSRTPPISSEFRGGRGLNTLNPPSRYATVCDHSSPICPHNFSFHTLSLYILCDMSYNSSLICGNKMPSRYNRGFYCRFYCLLNMFRAPLCTSSAAPASILQTGHITPSSAPDQQLENHSTKYHRQQTLYNTLELLMMGIVVPETC